MSLSTLLSLVEAMEDTRRPVYDFGMTMTPRQPPQTMMASAGMLSPWQCAHPACPTSPMHQIVANRHKRHSTAKQMQQQHHGADDSWHMPIAQVGKDGYQVCMDVAHFSPNELTVKVVDNSIVVEGKHEEREDGHGYISRHFIRRYALPKGYEADKVMSSLSSDGVLTVNVPKPKPIEDKTKERVVQIQQVGPAHLNVKPNTMEQKPEEKKETNGHSNTSTTTTNTSK